MNRGFALGRAGLPSCGGNSRRLTLPLIALAGTARPERRYCHSRIFLSIMVSEWDSSVPKRSRTVAFHASTALLLLGLVGLLLRLSGGSLLLSRSEEHTSELQ